MKSSNYPLWKFKIKHYLLANDLGHTLSNQTPQDPSKREIFFAKRSRTAGILGCYVDQNVYNRFTKEFESNNPTIIWTAISDYFEAKTDDNQSKVYQDFMALNYKSNVLIGFITNINNHLNSMMSVGLVIGKPIGAELKESLVAKFILSRLPAKFTSTKELLHTKQPLTVEMVKDTLENKLRDSRAPTGVVKSQNTVYAAYPTCSNGVDNPLTKHSEKEC